MTESEKDAWNAMLKTLEGAVQLGRLRTFEDRQRFRQEARVAIEMAKNAEDSDPWYYQEVDGVYGYGVNTDGEENKK